MIMQIRRDFDSYSRLLLCLATFALFARACNGGQLQESESFLNFIQAVDPKNILKIDWNGLVPHPCSPRWKGVKCSLRATTIVEIRLENMNLSGIIDTDSLCKIPNLRVLSLAENQIQGNIRDSISRCTSLTYLNLSSNFLNGSVPMVALTKLKNLRRLDISKNHFAEIVQHFKQEAKVLNKNSMESKEATNTVDALSPTNKNDEDHKAIEKWAWTPMVIGIGFFLLLTYFMNKNAVKFAKEKETLKFLAQTPTKTPRVNVVEELNGEERGSELVFFVEEEERFKLDDLLEAAADLQGQGLCSSLYKVQLKNNAVFAVKRLKKLQVPFDTFGETMRKIGKLKHQNILPLVGYNSTSEEKLLIYKYQWNGSLLNLFENYIGGKRDFPWKHRLSIAVGIARGLDFIHQRTGDEEIIPHGNIKLSNILLNEYEEPLISEYGYVKFLDPKRACLVSSNGYTAPEKSLTEQADVFSFGVILLELLTGKTIEKSGLDLPKWVKATVREEWTGEVFDKEVAKVGMYAFPLLNVSLKCVAHFPEHRPFMAEVLEKIEEIVNSQEDLSPTSVASIDTPQDGRFPLSVVPEIWESPGANQ